MNERLKELRITLKMNQEEFGKWLGISKSGISDIESGRRKVTDQHILMLCSNHDVNEEWLRTGNGEMFIELTRDEQIEHFVGDALKSEDDSFKKKFISMLATLDESEWEVLHKMVELMQENKKG